ncbi:hypothetical protein HYV30_04105 [Candidatus Kaiserbacteria bacterium]|nr:hypothetical protein [Candidatus Kaiserbacteria bacterium]
MPPHQSVDVSFGSLRHGAERATAGTRRRSLETISIVALFTTLIAAVFAFVPVSSVPFSATKTFILAAGVLVTLALYILARLSRGNIILPPLPLLGVLWLPALAYVLSAAFAGVPFIQALWGESLESDTLGFVLVAAGLGTLAALLLRRTDQYRSFLKVGGVTFGIIVLLQVLFMLIGQFAPTVIAPATSVLGSFDNLAYLLGLGVISILITLRSLELGTRARRALIGIGAFTFALLAVANSSFVWTVVGLVALGLFVEAVLLSHRSKAADADLDESVIVDEAPVEREGKSSLVMPLAALAISLFFLVGGTLGSALASALHVDVLNVRPSWQSTFSVARQVYAGAPMFGSGPGTFGMDWLKYRDASLNQTVFWNLDFTSGVGLIPTSMATTGLVGAVAWVAFLLLFIGLGLRTLILRAPQDPFVRYVAMLSFIAALYLFAVAIFDVPSTVIVALAFVFAGLFASTVRFADRHAQWGVIFARSPRIGFVIVFSFTILLLSSVVAAYSVATRYLAVFELTKASAAYATGDLAAAHNSAQKAVLFAPTPTAYQFEAAIMNSELSRIVNSTTLTPADAQQAFQNALSTGINAALTATRLAPGDYQNWLALGNLYAAAVPLGVSGAYDGAKAAYDKAAALNPTNPQIPYIQAQLEIANKDTAAAQNSLKAAISLKQDYTAAIFLLSQLQVREGKVKEALDSALAAAYFTPNNPNILFQVGILYAAQNDMNNAGAALGAAVNVNPQFANARYFLAAVLAKQGKLTDALAQVQAIADMSDENAKAVEKELAELKAGRNPFPQNLLSLPSTPVEQ